MTRLRPIERVRLTSDIGRAVQASMKVAEIEGYLAAFGVRVTINGPVTSKWVLVRELLSAVPEDTLIAIARDLGVATPASLAAGTADLSQLLSERGLQVCQEDFARALGTVDNDPATAIGHACTMLESICKGILDSLGVPLPKDETLKPLMKAVAESLDLSPEKHADAEIKQALGGLANTVAGIAVLRSKFSSFHGKSPKQRRLVGRHARLAVNAAAAAGQFLIETYVARFGGTSMDNLSAIEEHIGELEEMQGAPFTSEGRKRIIEMFRPPPDAVK